MQLLWILLVLYDEHGIAYGDYYGTIHSGSIMGMGTSGLRGFGDIKAKRM